MMGTAAPTDGMSVNIETMEATATQLSTAARALSITDDVVKNLQNRIDRRGWDAVNTALNALAAAHADLASSIGGLTGLQRQINERIILLQEANGMPPLSNLPGIGSVLAGLWGAIERENLKAEEDADAVRSPSNKRRLIQELLNPDPLLFNIRGDKVDRFEWNKQITRSYAQLYLENPQLYKWAGMAAFASAEVGAQIDYLRSIVTNPYFSDTGEYKIWILIALLQEGNLKIHDNIAWQFIAYQQGNDGSGGLDKLEIAYKNGILDYSAFQAWQKIDEGERTGNQNLVWEGNKELIIYEQRVVLQPVTFGPASGLWKEFIDLKNQASSLWGLEGQFGEWLFDFPAPPSDIPIPGGSDFENDIPNHNIANIDDRLKAILNNMLPEYKEFESHPDDMRTAMEAFADGKSSSEVQSLIRDRQRTRS